MHTALSHDHIVLQSQAKLFIKLAIISQLCHNTLNTIENKNMRISYSAIETYLQCPKKFKYQYLDKIKAPKSREAIFGTLIHSALRYMFSKDPLFPTLDEVIDYFRENWPKKEVFESESKNDPLKRPWSKEEQKAYFEEGVRMLKRFYEKNAPWNFTVVDLESRFEVLINDEKTNQTHILAGIIDRIDKHNDDTYEIIDYKTTKRMPSQESVDQNLQLSLYSLGLRKRWPHLRQEDIKLSLYFLKHGEKLTTNSNDQTAQKAKEYILNTIGEIQEKISSNQEFEPHPGPLCDWCPYRPICPAWRHLYSKEKKEKISDQEVSKYIDEYFKLDKEEKEIRERMGQLKEKIKNFMEQENLYRAFGSNGYFTKKTVPHFRYDFERIKELLSPLGLWEEILKADESKLKKIFKSLPLEVQKGIENSRTMISESVRLTPSKKNITQKYKIPDDESEQNPNNDEFS